MRIIAASVASVARIETAMHLVDLVYARAAMDDGVPHGSRYDMQSGMWAVADTPTNEDISMDWKNVLEDAEAAFAAIERAASYIERHAASIPAAISDVLTLRALITGASAVANSPAAATQSGAAIVTAASVAVAASAIGASGPAGTGSPVDPAQSRLTLLPPSAPQLATVPYIAPPAPIVPSVPAPEYP